MALVAAMAAVAVIDREPDLIVIAFLFLFLLFWLVCWYVGAVRPRLELTEDTLVVVNPLGTRRLPLTCIRRACPGYAGIQLDLLDDTSVTVWAVQKANAAAWSGVRTRADDIAAVINAACAGKGRCGS